MATRQDYNLELNRISRQYLRRHLRAFLLRGVEEDAYEKISSLVNRTVENNDGNNPVVAQL